MGGKGGGRIGTCELQVREEGGEADKGGYRGAGIGAPGACCVGEHVVVRALEGDAPLLEGEREADRTEEEKKEKKKTSEGGETAGRRKWRNKEYARFCRDTNIGMWEGVWRRAGKKTTTPKGDG